MAVFRVERNKGYTVMSNHHLRNKELTLKAKACCRKRCPCRKRGITPLRDYPTSTGKKSTQYAKRYGSLKKPGISSVAANATRKDACVAQTILFTSSRLYRIYLHWKIQRWKNLHWKIQRN